MSDSNTKCTPERVVSQVSEESGYMSNVPSPGMIVSITFRGTCKKKVRENFRYLKENVEPITALEEVQATHPDLFTQQGLEELKESKRFRQKDKLLKRLIRKGEDYCKSFLKSFQSETIQSLFVLETLVQLQDKTVQHIPTIKVTATEIRQDYSLICEELDNSRVLDPLLEYYILTLDEHDRVEYNFKIQCDKNASILDTLLRKSSEDWVPGFVYVLENNDHRKLLEQIKKESTIQRDHICYEDTYTMSIKVTGVNSIEIERKLAFDSEIDDLCRRLAHLAISDIKKGSVLLMVHPMIPNEWQNSTKEEKEKLLQDFIRQLMDKPDIKDLIKKEVSVTIDVQEIRNIFGNTSFRGTLKKSVSLSQDQQLLDDNWTYLTEEIDVNRIMEKFESDQVMTSEERQKISFKIGRRERASEFLNWFMEKLQETPIHILISCLKATGQILAAKRLQDKSVCIDCLIATYRDSANYKILLSEMVSSIMERTVAKFKGTVPHHISNILTPACGKSRRDRAQLFLQYVLLNAEVLRSFANTLATIDFVPLEPKQCNTCQPKGLSTSLEFSHGLVEDEDGIHCVLSVKKEPDRSLKIELSKSAKKEKEKPLKVEKFKEEMPRSDTGPSYKYQKVLETALEDPLGATKIEDVPRPISRISSESYFSTGKDFAPTVVAIDFGTTYSGFAFSLKKDNAKIYTKKWNNASGKGQESDKTPTTILLNSNQEFVAFGYDAELKYQQLCEEDKNKSYFYFRHFKMHLHVSTSLKRSTLIEDVLGKTMPAIKVFSLAIRYLQKEAKMALLANKCSKDNISWVLTVPAIWDDSAKQFMREAAEQANIKKLTIALEPEVASVYIGLQTVEKSVDASGANLVKSSPGFKFMVVDVGGGTADITIMETSKNNKLKQISIASGGPCGGEFINDQILSKVKSVVGTDVSDLFCQSNTCEYNQLIGDIELAKRAWGKGKELKLRLPVCLIDLYKSKTGKSLLEQAGSSDGISMKKDKLVFSPELADRMIQMVIDKIIKHAKKSLKQSEDISHIVIVGGFADNAVLKEELEKQFSAFKVIIPAEPGLAVLKGAVLFGHDPTCVSMRRCDRTYGTQVYRAFIEGTDPTDKLFIENGIRYCKDAFDSFAKIGESLEIGETRFHQIEPIRSGMPVMSVKLYGSTDPNPLYVTDKSCTYLGKIVVDIPENRRTVKEKFSVSMTFGQTEILVEGKSEHSKEFVKTKIDFLLE